MTGMTNEQALAVLADAAHTFNGYDLPLRKADAQKARAHFAALIARNAELETDARRLDWLDENGAAVRRRDFGRRNLIVWNWNDNGRQVKLRAAIDAAQGAAA